MEDILLFLAFISIAIGIFMSILMVHSHSMKFRIAGVILIILMVVAIFLLDPIVKSKSGRADHALPFCINIQLIGSDACACSLWLKAFIRCSNQRAYDDF